MRSLPIVLTLLLSGCASRLTAAPPLLAEAPTKGRAAFFDALAEGDYASLDGILGTLQAEADAGDPRSRAVLGFAHAWRLSEWRRAPTPDVVSSARLAVHAFDDASRALPEDSRLVGFLGAMRLAVGSIEGRGGSTRRGWFNVVESAHRWPEWGLFTQAYGLVSLDPDSARYAKGIDLMWANLDACADERVPRADLNWSTYADSVATDGDLLDVRACTNTPVVPHNLEGFFVVFGDLYAKRGDLEEARMMYDNALAMDPGDWPYRHVAQDRVDRLEQLPALFAIDRSDDPDARPEDMVMFGSTISCSGCHQASSGDAVGALPYR